jgi:hypothetical protein
MDVNGASWTNVRRALRSTAGRLRAVASAVEPGLRVTARWTVADTLAHLCAVVAIDIAMVTGNAPDLPVPGLGEIRVSTTVDTVADMNAAVLSRFRERNVGVLLDRLDRDLRRLLDATAAAEAPLSVSWLGGATLPIDGLLAHLLNEMDIHGWDIARAARIPWRTEPADAALFLELFVVGVVRNGYGRLLDREGPVRGVGDDSHVGVSTAAGQNVFAGQMRQSGPYTLAVPLQG